MHAYSMCMLACVHTCRCRHADMQTCMHPYIRPHIPTRTHTSQKRRLCFIPAEAGNGQCSSTRTGQLYQTCMAPHTGMPGCCVSVRQLRLSCEEQMGPKSYHFMVVWMPRTRPRFYSFSNLCIASEDPDQPHCARLCAVLLGCIMCTSAPDKQHTKLNLLQVGGLSCKSSAEPSSVVCVLGRGKWRSHTLGDRGALQ